MGLFTPIYIASLLSMVPIHYELFGYTRSATQISQSYDFIIVGGGTAGCILAARLTEDPNVRVLLLEMGGSGSFITDMPWMSRINLRTVISRSISSTKQQHACGENGICELSVAQVLGGGSTHNEMGYLRGCRKDYDEWANGWSYDEMLPYLKRLENAEQSLGADEFRGREGPISVISNIGPNYHFTEFSKRWVTAAISLGHPVGDYNGPRLTVFAPIQVIVQNGRRASTDNAYIRPNEHRSNLDILMFAHVNRLLFQDNKVVGVEYDRAGQGPLKVHATKEVILSAGALATPKILMLSGIGPADQLDKFNIPVKVQMDQVGKNLQDHPTLDINFTTTAQLPPWSDGGILNFLNWQTTGQVFGSTLAMGVGFLRTSLSEDLDDARARMWIHLVLNDKTSEFEGFSLWTYVAKPESKGQVWLKSSDPYDDLLVDPNYLESENDRQNLYEGLRETMRVMRSEPFRQINAEPVSPIVKRCQTFDLWSDNYLKCIAQSEARTEFHYCCTAAMGSVVDARLKVKGIKGLRIVDASVMPSIPRVNTNAPVMAIAEKAADLIKEDWQLLNYYNQ